MEELLEYRAHYRRLEAHQEFDWNDVEPILAGMADFAERELAALSAPGDAAGASFHEGRVASPEGFREAYRRYVDAGWPRLGNPPELGGQPAPYSLKLIGSEFLQAANQAWCMYALLNDGGIRTLLSQHASSPTFDFARELVSGEWMSTMCLSEPQCGSDLNLVRCGAQPDADGTFRISGTKMFVSSGEQDFTDDIVHLVLARLPDAPPGTRGISLFAVPKRLGDVDGAGVRANGVRALSIEHKMGLRASATCVMSFDSAIGWLVGAPNRGLAAMFVFINKSRLGTAQQAHAQAEASFQLALRYARERRAGHSPDSRTDESHAAPLIAHPDIRRMLLTQKALAEGGRALVLYCAQWVDLADEPDDAVRQRAEERLALLTPIAKGVVSEWATEATDLGLQVMGGHGYVVDSGMEQRVRDARVTRIYEGTTGIQGLDLLGRKVLGARRNTFNEWTGEIIAWCDEVESSRVGKFGPLLQPLRKAVGTWSDITTLAARESETDPNFVGAASVDYLMLAGYVTVGYFWAQAAVVSQRRLDQGGGDTSFHRAKLETAKFYFSKLLPRVDLHAAAIRAGSAPVMGLAAEDFGP